MKTEMIFRRGLLERNPVLVTALGLCSTLAVTTMVKHAVTMTVMVCLTLVVSSLITSLLRKRIPNRFRLLVNMLVVSTAVTSFDRLVSIFVPDLSRELGPYVGLVITNCIILGHLESSALVREPSYSVVDAAGTGAGFGVFIIAMAAVRELVGMGSFLGFSVAPDWYRPVSIFATAPGAFLVFAVLVALFKALSKTGRADGRSLDD